MLIVDTSKYYCFIQHIPNLLVNNHMHPHILGYKKAHYATNTDNAS